MLPCERIFPTLKIANFLNVVKKEVMQHLTYFSLTAVRNLCKKHGLKLYDYDHIKTKGGSIRYYISKDATKKISKKVISLLNYETKFGLFKKQKYNHMKSKINSSFEIDLVFNYDPQLNKSLFQGI